MTSSVGIILVHGYTGSSKDLHPLSRSLSTDFGPDCVSNISLPGHYTNEHTPSFSIDKFQRSISAAIDKHLCKNREIILVGHSTGGTIALSYLADYSFTPALLVLAAVPKKIDVAYFERWNHHSSDDNQIPLTELAKMVSAINSVDSSSFGKGFPVLILQGEKDDLVSMDEALAWQRDKFPSSSISIVQNGEHRLFCGPNSTRAIDLVKQFISDYTAFKSSNIRKEEKTLTHLEPGLKRFFHNSPYSANNFIGSPGGQSALGSKYNPRPVAATQPVIANIEITTYCNLQCKFCARTSQKKETKHMTKEVFRNILEELPYTYRIALVGLGEPLLNTHVADIVSEASSQHRSVGIITNAMFLDEGMSRELLQAGLNSITFSIDSPDQAIADELRSGSNFSKIISNIKNFIKLSQEHGQVSTSIFCAVSVKNVIHLPRIVDVAVNLGINALMITDLNYEKNSPHSLKANPDLKYQAAVKKAIRAAFSKKLPVISIRALEEFGIKERYLDFLMLRPKELFQRTERRTNCFSPWQTIPIDVDGNITVCDCQPDKNIGNILHRPITEMWNDQIMIEHRKKMISRSPPAVCASCPRF